MTKLPAGKILDSIPFSATLHLRVCLCSSLVPSKPMRKELVRTNFDVRRKQESLLLDLI